MEIIKKGRLTAVVSDIKKATENGGEMRFGIY